MGRKKVLFPAVALTCMLFFFSIVCSAAKQNNLENFNKNTRPEIAFTDVRTTDWFNPYVKTVSKMGLMVGQSSTEFNPNGNITLAETYTIAARLHSIYHTGQENFKQTGIWYQIYLDYAKKSNIHFINTTNYNRLATRAEFAQILSSAFPQEALTEINTLSDTAIPDVSIQKTYGKAVYTLYRAGVLTGNDEMGTFAPNRSIKRSEVAAIVSRMAIPGERVLISLTVSDNQSNENTQEPPVSEEPIVPEITEPTFFVETTEATVGQNQVAVTISVKNNPGISALALNLSFDSNLVLDSVVYNDQLVGETLTPQTIKNPTKLIWISPFEDVTTDFILATVYFNVPNTANAGTHQISVTYNPDDVFKLSEENVHFDVIHGGILVTK